MVVSPVEFILLGLSLSKPQEELLTTPGGYPKNCPTFFLWRLQVFRALQEVYMPGLRRYLENKPSDRTGEDSSSRRMGLWLPSDIEVDSRSSVCETRIVEIEESIREARCFDLLALIRHNLRVKTRIPEFLNGARRCQCSLERSTRLTGRILTQVKAIAEQYRRNRDALVSLRGEGQWEEELRVISDRDVQTLEPGLKQMGDTGEVVEQVAWIWGTASVAIENNELLRGEWCRSWRLVQIMRDNAARLLEELCIKL